MVASGSRFLRHTCSCLGINPGCIFIANLSVYLHAPSLRAPGLAVPGRLAARPLVLSKLTALLLDNFPFAPNRTDPPI